MNTPLSFLLNPFGLIGWQWGNWHPACHLGFEVLGYITSFYLYKHQSIPDILPPADRKKLKWWTLGGAIIGAKLVPFFETFTSVGFSALLSGKSLAGGLLGGIVGSELGKWKLKFAGVSTGDVLVYPLLWGSIVGRLGCSSSAVIDGMLGVPIPVVWQAKAAWLGVLVQNSNTTVALKPALVKVLQLNQGIVWNTASLEILGLLLIAGGLRWMTQKGQVLKTGVLFYSFCLGYFLLRLGLEGLKHAESTLTVVQIFSLIGIAFSCWQLFFRKSKATVLI